MTEIKWLVFRFAKFEVREREYSLANAGVAVPIEPKAFRVLLFLLRNPGRLVTKDEIVNAVWNDSAVSDNSLTRTIATLRRLLDDDRREPKYIATVQTVGYRFVCDVTASEDGAQPLSPAPDQPQARRRYWKPIAAVLAVASATLFIWLLAGHGNLSGRLWRSIAHRAGVSNGQGGPGAIRRRRLTNNPEDAPITSAAISPDGKYLAYSDSTGFYLKVVDTGETRPVAFADAFTPAVESWFSDSVHLVVSWVEESSKPPGLWMTSVLGGTPRKLADVGSFARVSPDGKKIAFLRGPWDDNQIWMMDPDGNHQRKVLDAGLDYFGPVAWSADSQRFAAVRSSVERQAGQIVVYDSRTDRAESVLSIDGVGPDLLWTASGKLIYSRPEAAPSQEDANLWSTQLNLQTGRPSGGAIRMTNDKDLIGAMSTSRDEGRLAIIRYSHQGDVFLSTIEGKELRLSVPRRFTLDLKEDFPSSWTPDGKAVLIVSNRDGVSHIFKQKTTETQPELFVGGKEDVWLPHMTPDGSNMLYLASAENVGPSDKVRLMSIPLPGGPSRVVLEEPGIVNYQCARLPSEICIYGEVGNENYTFYAFNSLTGARSQLPVKMEKGSAMNNWNLSPDGKFLAIVDSKDPYKGPRILIVSVADGTERSLTLHELKLVIGVDWAADSKSMWLGGFMERSSWDNRSGLVNMDLKGRVHIAIAGKAPLIMGGIPSPDGRTLALGANTFSSNVWLLENP